jgi:hypothetical protein
MKDATIGLGLIMTAGVAVMALMVIHKPIGRLVLTWRKNPDGTCTYTYDDGSQETGVCTEAPA